MASAFQSPMILRNKKVARNVIPSKTIINKRKAAPDIVCTTVESNSSVHTSVTCNISLINNDIL